MVWCVVCEKITPLNPMKAREQGWSDKRVQTNQGNWRYFLCPECSTREDEAIAMLKLALRHDHKQEVWSWEKSWHTIDISKTCSVCAQLKWDIFEDLVTDQDTLDKYF